MTETREQLDRRLSEVSRAKHEAPLREELAAMRDDRDAWVRKHDNEFSEHVRTRQALTLTRGRLEETLARLSTPELHDFATAVAREAAHQRDRNPANHDAAKTPGDWFWTLGHLAGKAMAAAIAGDVEKALHHTISSAGLLANWHAMIKRRAAVSP